MRYCSLRSLIAALVLLSLILPLGCGSATPLQAANVAPGSPSAIPYSGPGNASRPNTEEMPVADGPVDGYLAVAPRVLRAGQTETISVSLFSGSQPAAGPVQVVLTGTGGKLAEASGQIQGRGELSLAIPAASEGAYELVVNGQGFEGQTSVRVEDGTLLFVETDKPIYKPGQTVHLRVLTLDPQLLPVEAKATVEVADAKGIRVFRKELRTDGFGMASLDMPLSAEPNLGVWKVTAAAGKRTSQIDFRVERYVLPKYEVRVDLPQDWTLASEPVRGRVAAEYSYGKPVRGQVQIKAIRYVGTWQEYANLNQSIDGAVEFELPPVQYVSGVPGARGMGNISLEVTVQEEATGYEEKTTRLVSVAASPVVLRLIPESVTFKPSLPLSLLVVAETPDKKPVDTDARLEVAYTNKEYRTSRESLTVRVTQGKAMVQINPPAEAISLTLNATAGNAKTSAVLQAGYSPSGSFILVEPLDRGALKVGDTARFKVSATREAANFYYEVMARGKVVYSDYSPSPEISVPISPMMAPSARLLVYQLLPTSEVAADYIPFSVQAGYPQQIAVQFSQAEVRPGEAVDVLLQTEGSAKVGLAAVDRSVFILAENRVNLQQVFAELERLYQKPQVELHEARPIGPTKTRGAKDIFTDAGVVVLSNKTVPEGQEVAGPMRRGIPEGVVVGPAAGAVPAPAATAPADTSKSESLAEVQRVRQFFPETWIWTDLATGADGRGGKQFQVPDSITTWMLRAVALSKQHGLGISEAQLRVMQPFFVQVDLPYSAIRGEQFPVRVALYNYTQSPQQFTVDIEPAGWFALADEPSKSVQVGPNSVGAASFQIRPAQLGPRSVKITARSQDNADAIIKEMIVEPEGVQREMVENRVLAAAGSYRFDMGIPSGVIEGSPRALLAISGNYLSQTIEGLEGLLKMPFGCGEQNMVLFAPNVFIAKYLKETNQLKPEVMAKAENMMITGYQRELIYRRGDGSFSAFGESDKVGSLWLTAFVMKTFAQAKGLIFIDDTVLAASKAWISKQQGPDGSFEPVGFVHHKEMMGGVQGKTALTAYLAVALQEAGDQAASLRAIKYLEGALDTINDSYTLALTSYALQTAKNSRAEAAYRALMAKARQSDGGLYWDSDRPEPIPLRPDVEPGVRPGIYPPRPRPSLAIETTAYATLALLERGDNANAALAVRWLVGKRNSSGGFGTTQDTVVALQALTRYAVISRSSVDASLVLRNGDWRREVRVSPDNADVVQIIEAPAGGILVVEGSGRGDVVVQAVRRFNIPDPERGPAAAFQVDVTYSAGSVQVDDLIDVRATLRFTPPLPVQAGMVVLDVAVPTGFAAEAPTVARAVQQDARIKRHDIAGRKVVFYIEDMQPGDEVQIAFKAKALYPVRAQAVTSQAYSYYKPEWKGESLGGDLTISD